MTEPITNPDLEWYRLLDGVMDSPHAPSIDVRPQLPNTAALLGAVRMAAQAEMAERGFGDTTLNPIDVLRRSSPPTPLFNRLAAAVSSASAATAFDAPAPTPAQPARPFRAGDRVRLVLATNGIPANMEGRTGDVSNTAEPESLGVTFITPNGLEQTWWTHPRHLELA